MTASALPASLLNTLTRRLSAGPAASPAVGEASLFPALLGDLIGGEAHPDARQRLKLGAKSEAKFSKTDDGTPVGLPIPLLNPLNIVVPKPVEPANFSPVPTLAELATDLSMPAIPDAEPSAAESGGPADGLQANRIAAPASQPAMPGAPEATEEIQARQTSPGIDAVLQSAATEGAPTEGAPADNAPPDWTRLLDSAGAGAPPEAAQIDRAPRPAGLHSATAHQKVTALRSAHVPEPAAIDPKPLTQATPLAAPLAVPEERPAHPAQPSPLSRLESEVPALRRQPAAIPTLAAPRPDAPAQAAEQAAEPLPSSINVGEAPTPAPNAVSTIAFEAHLTPITAQNEAPTKAGALDRPPLVAADAPGKPAVAAAAPSAGAATDRQPDNAPSSGQERKDSAPERLRKTDAPPVPGGEEPPTAGKAALHMPVAPEPQADRVSGQPASSSGPTPLRSKETVELPAAPETAPAPAAAHDIRLEVNAGDRHVEVRLVERDGEVHVAVRTPDAHLAETLREDLPALSSRLTDSGFRTETWRPGASGSTELHRQAEPASGASPQDSSGQPHQNGREQEPGGQPSARPKVLEEQLHHKEKGKDFEWFMSTLQ